MTTADPPILAAVCAAVHDVADDDVSEGTIFVGARSRMSAPGVTNADLRDAAATLCTLGLLVRRADRWSAGPTPRDFIDLSDHQALWWRHRRERAAREGQR